MNKYKFLDSAFSLQDTISAKLLSLWACPELDIESLPRNVDVSRLVLPLHSVPPERRNEFRAEFENVSEILFGANLST